MKAVITGLNEEQTQIIYDGLGLNGWFDCDYADLHRHISGSDLTDAAKDEFLRTGSKNTTIEGNFLITTITKQFGEHYFSTTYRECVKNNHVYDKEFSSQFKQNK
jgi:hypothetical protein